MTMATKVLLADDEATIRHILKLELENKGYDVLTARDGNEAYELARHSAVEAAILDIRMPGMDGFNLLKELRGSAKDMVIIMMTAFGTIDGAVVAMKMGADDYITKPFDNEELTDKLDQLLRIKMKKLTIKSSRTKYDVSLIGEDETMEKIHTKINKVKNLDTTVLITGESGTGKGVVAKEIHNSSERRELPFMHVDCAFLPENLIESELFGHEKGAFTNAVNMKKGKFELAGKGTIFLDEIGTLPINLQSKLLNVLQERYIYRVGGSEKIPIEARVIAATNENLERAVKSGQFREDLYYRLNVVRIECPPLRFRRRDIDRLAKHFFVQHMDKNGKYIERVDPEVWRIIEEYDWPGNVRELENAIESAVVLCDGEVLRVEDLPLRVQNKDYLKCSEASEGGLSLREQEMLSIIAALERNGGHRERTARDLGISRRTLQYKLKKFNLN